MKSSTLKFTERNWPFPFRELVDKGRWKQSDLAARAELQPSAISQYLNGSRTPGAWEIYRLAKALGTTVEYLLTGEAADEEGRYIVAEAAPPDTSEIRAKLAVIKQALAEAEAALKKI